MLADQLKILFPDEDDEGAFVVPALDTRSQVLSIKDRRNGVGKPAFELASLGSGQAMDSRPSSASTAPSLDDDFEHNIWNPLLNLLFLEQVSGIFVSFIAEIDLAKIALSCHFALDVLCYKEDVFDSAR